MFIYEELERQNRKSRVYFPITWETLAWLLLRIFRSSPFFFFFFSFFLRGMKLIHMDGFIWSSTQNLAVEKTDMPPF